MSERRSRRKRRRHSEDDDDDEGGVSNWKLGLVVAVIVICFAVLYPSVLHPLFFGRSQPAPQPSRPPVHPGMGGGRGPRPDVHPAMRMAAAQAETQTSSGGRGGMYTWMLPIYTVGVVIFLLYTLFKSKKKSRRKRRGSSSDESGEDVDAPRGSLGRKKLRGLQERLRQTEEAMSKILAQLEAAQAAGETLKEELEQNEKADTKEKEEKEGEKRTTGDYMQDLETALQEFKQLSDSYDKAKEELEEHDENDEDSADSEDSEVDVDGVDESEEEEEEEEEEERKKSKEEEDKDEILEELIAESRRTDSNAPKGLRKRVRKA